MGSQHIAANCKPISRPPQLEPLSRPPPTPLDHHRDTGKQTAGQAVIERDEESSTDNSSDSDSSNSDDSSTSKQGDIAPADAVDSTRRMSIGPGGTGVVTVRMGGR